MEFSPANLELYVKYVGSEFRDVSYDPRTWTAMTIYIMLNIKHTTLQNVYLSLTKHYKCRPCVRGLAVPLLSERRRKRFLLSILPDHINHGGTPSFDAQHFLSPLRLIALILPPVANSFFLRKMILCRKEALAEDVLPQSHSSNKLITIGHVAQHNVEL